MSTSTSAQAVEYVYSPGRIAAPRGLFAGQAAGSAKPAQTKINFLPEVGTVVRAPMDSSIVEQQIRRFMVEKRGNVATVTSTTAFYADNSTSVPPPKGIPAPPQLTERSNLNTRSTSPAVVGLRRGPVVGRGASPPVGRLGRKGSPPMNGSPMAEKGQSPPVSREQSPSPASQRLAVVDKNNPRRRLTWENIPQNRPRSATDVGPRPPFAQPPRSTSPAPTEFRPAVPAKDDIDHSRSRSLSPPGHGKVKEEKQEKRRNVFGLFPSERKEKERDGEGKRGVAEHIVAVFHRKQTSSASHQLAGESPAMSSRTVPTPLTAHNSPPFGLSPPQPWINSATTPPMNQFGFHARKNSSANLRQTPQHSRDNSASTNASASHYRNPTSALSNQPWSAQPEQDVDIKTAIEKVWGHIENSPVQAKSALQRASPSTPAKYNRSRSRTPQAARQLSNEWPDQSPLLPPVNKKAYQKRTLPPAPLSKVVEPAELEAHKTVEEEPVEPLLPVAYNPNEPESPRVEPLQPISMFPMSPKRLADRVSHRLSVSIPQVGRRTIEATSAPGTPAEFYKAGHGEMRYYLELPAGLGEFHLDSAVEAQEEDEDDILVWLDSLKFDGEQGEQPTPEQAVSEQSQIAAPQLTIEASSPAVESPPAVTPAAEIKITRPASPSFIPRKPVASSAAKPASPAAQNFLSPPVPQHSPPSPSDYSGAFSGRVSFASSIGDAFKYDSYADEVEAHMDWRSSGEVSELGGLRLQGVTTTTTTTSPSVTFSSPQTNPSTTFSSPNLSDYTAGTPSSGGLCGAEIDAILGKNTFDVYIDDQASSGMPSSEIEAILVAQMREDEERMKQTHADRKRDEDLDREYVKRMEARRTIYVRGRNSQFEDDILFILKSEDIPV